MEEIKKILGKIGFNLYESKILICLISEGGYKNAKEIAEGAGVPLSRIYSILLRFEKAGLIKKIKGKESLYSSVEKKQIIDILRQKKINEMKEEKVENETALSFLNEKISEIQKNLPSEVNVKYFTNNESYWKEYGAATGRLRHGDIYRLINNLRLCSGYLREELEKMPKIQRSVFRKESHLKGIQYHYILNPKSVVKNTIKALKGKEKIIRSLCQMLMECRTQKWWVTLSPTFENIFIFIIADSVFMEFYSKSTAEISSAIQIRNREIARDFSRWFDGFSGNEKHVPEKDYKRLKEETLKWAEKLAKIKPTEFSKTFKLC